MKYFRIARFIIYVIVAVLIGVFHDFMIDNLKYFLSCLLFAYAINALVFAIYYHPHSFLNHRRFYWGVTELILGLIVIFGVNEFTHLCIIWAVWSILRETEEIREAIIDFKHYITSIASLLESVANMVLSIMLIIHSGVEHATIHLYLLIAELVLASGLPLFSYYYYKEKEVVSETV